MLSAYLVIVQCYLLSVIDRTIGDSQFAAYCPPIYLSGIEVCFGPDRCGHIVGSPCKDNVNNTTACGCA
jgi:hypothetical protein